MEIFFADSRFHEKKNDRSFQLMKKISVEILVMISAKACRSRLENKNAVIRGEK